MRLYEKKWWINICVTSMNLKRKWCKTSKLCHLEAKGSDQPVIGGLLKKTG